MDVIAKNGDVVLRLDLPGIDPAKDLTVTAEGGELTISGERKTMEEIKEENFYRTEVFKGTFQGNIPLPEGTPTDKITAQYANGVLEVVVPSPTKPAKAKPKDIPVKFETLLKA